MAEQEEKLSVVQLNSKEITAVSRIVSFRSRPMVLVSDDGFDHYVPLRRERFERLAYPLLGGITRSRMGDVFSFISNTAEDYSENDHLILFGKTEIGGDGRYMHGVPFVWDSKSLAPTDIAPTHAIWRSPYAMRMPKRGEDGKRSRLKFIMDLAGNDEGLYDDIMQSLAPLIMEKKPDGVIWWVGDGANGKSTLMDAIYRLFPGQLSSITVKRLVDGRDTPSLNGTLANVVKESSEGRVEDTEIYKAIGTHENFRVHKFHSQDDVEIRGNMHHIFSANTIPIFNDKGYSARRRTFIIPFKQVFQSDPTFEEKTFTPEFFGELITEMARYANRIKDQGYKYKWSAVTLAAKADYDSEANNAEEYVREMIDQGLVAFDNYKQVHMDYENWAGENGFIALGMGNLKRALSTLGFERVSRRLDTATIVKVYKLPSVDASTLVTFSLSKPGMFTLAGFKPKKDETVPKEVTEKKKSVLKGGW